MTRPFLLAQLTDPHIGAKWNGRSEPTSALAAAIEALRALPDRPDAVVVTGDLTHRGKRRQYAVVREQLERLELPYHVLAGNHDLRAKLREAFALEGDGDDPIRYSADVGPLRLVALDTTIPGAAGGALDAAELQWLASALADAPERPTVIAMHHPPLETGVPAWDATAIAGAQRAALQSLLAGNPQVQAIVAGHLHRSLVANFAGRPLVVAPSTALQSLLDWSCDEFVLVAEPPAFALHAWAGEQLVTHLQPVRRD